MQLKKGDLVECIDKCEKIITTYKGTYTGLSYYKTSLKEFYHKISVTQRICDYTDLNGVKINKINIWHYKKPYNLYLKNSLIKKNE